MGTMIDLTRAMSAGMPVYPGDPIVQDQVAADHGTDGFHVSRLAFGTHAGTHLDAPFHFFKDGETLDAFPVSTFFLSAAVLDLRGILAEHARPGLPTVISWRDLEPFAPVFESVGCVILRTDWSDRWGEPDYFSGFPSLVPDTADHITDFPVQILGLETPSLSSLAHFAVELGNLVDTGKDGGDQKDGDGSDLEAAVDEVLGISRLGIPTHFGAPAVRTREDGAVEAWNDRSLLREAFLLHSDSECHRILLGRTPPVLLLEGLVNLERLPCIGPDDHAGITGLNGGRIDASPLAGKVFDLVCLPLALAHSDGAPARTVAVLRNDEGPRLSKSSMPKVCDILKTW